MAHKVIFQVLMVHKVVFQVLVRERNIIVKINYVNNVWVHNITT